MKRFFECFFTFYCSAGWGEGRMESCFSSFSSLSQNQEVEFQILNLSLFVLFALLCRTGAVGHTSFAPFAKNFLEESVDFTLPTLLVLLGSH